MSFDLGDGVALRHTVLDGDGSPASATVVLTVTKPDGTTTLTPAIDELSTGVYANAPFVVDALGIWFYEWSVSGTVTDVVTGSFQVSEPGAPAYVSLTRLKAYIGITDNARDSALEDAALAASRAIDAACGRRFWLDWTVSDRDIDTYGRTFRAGTRYGLIVPDIASSTGLVAGRTVTTDSEDGGPITRLYSSYAWADETVTITARWGWPSIPADIAQATKIYAARLFKRKDSPEGIAASAEFGAIRVTRRDPDVQALIDPYVLPGLA